MKNLCTTKKYDLSQLNDEQSQTVLDWLKENDTGWDNSYIDKLKSRFCILYNHHGEWKLQTSKGNETNAIELFEEETHLLTAQDFVNASKGLAQIGIVLKQMSENLNTVSKIINDKMCLDSDINALIEKGKQHGLKIVVTFEKL